MNFNNPFMTSFADSGSAGGSLMAPKPRQGFGSFLRGKIGNWAERSAKTKYGDSFANETDPGKRRQMMLGGVGDQMQSLGGGQQDAPPPPELLPPGTVGGAGSIADIVAMIRARRQQPQQMGRMGVRGLFG
jgi:hypothetical protein